MRKLISANFSRLWKSHLFWICMGTMLVYSVAFMLNGCRQAIRNTSEYHYVLEDFYFQFAISIGGFCAIFSSLFHGTEYSDGTLRNKIVAGHSRTAIYLANLLLTFTATLLFLLAWIVGAMVAIPTLGLWELSPLGLFLCLSIAVLFIAAFSAIFTAVSMLCPNKAFCVTVSMLLFLGLLAAAAHVDNRLKEPEMSNGIVVTSDGIEMGDPEPNPDYLKGTMRSVYEFFNDFLPTGQSLQLTYLEMVRPIHMLLYSLFLTVTVTLGGIWAFRGKNLN